MRTLDAVFRELAALAARDFVLVQQPTRVDVLTRDLATRRFVVTCDSLLDVPSSRTFHARTTTELVGAWRQLMEA